MNIPTAEEFLDKYRKEFNDNGIVFDYSKVMIKWAKLHVKAALQEALESIPCLGSSTDIASYEEIEKAVLNSYPLTLIK